MSKNQTTIETGDAPVFSNLSNGVPLRMGEMNKLLRSLMERFAPGWPKVVGGQLCCLRKKKSGDFELRGLDKSAKLFGWIANFATVCWSRKGMSKDEFFSELPEYLERYDWATSHWHFPWVSGVLYLGKPPAAKCTGRLDELVSKFNPATPEDGLLLKAFIISLFWGGPWGKRPLFLFTTNGRNKTRGRATGKTSLVTLLSKLVGGHIDLQINGSEDRILGRLLTPSAQSKRVVLFDNIKSRHLSHWLFESLVTIDQISGHRMWHGNATIPNTFVYAMTINAPSLSTDFALRAVPIELAPPVNPSGTWWKTTTKFIEQHRLEVIADIRQILDKTSPRKLKSCGSHSREWASEVLARLPDPDNLVELIAKRQNALDDDECEIEELVAHVRECLNGHLREMEKDADQSRVHIPLSKLSEWAREVHPQLNRVTKFVEQANLPELKVGRSKSSRYCVWTGRGWKEGSETYVGSRDRRGNLVLTSIGKPTGTPTKSAATQPQADRMAPKPKPAPWPVPKPGQRPIPRPAPRPAPRPVPKPAPGPVTDSASRNGKPTRS